MSLDAMRWAFQQTGLRSSVKFVLVALADRANDEGECWPSREVIAADEGVAPNTVRSRCAERPVTTQKTAHKRQVIGYRITQYTKPETAALRIRETFGEDFALTLGTILTSG